MPISSPGLGSGLDVAGIVSQLMTIERQPLLRLDRKEVEVQAEISAYGSLKGSLYSLQDSLAKLKDADTYLATKASSSNQDVFAVTSDTDAVASSYSVTVNRLAQYHKLGSSEFASTDTFGGAAGDSLTLSSGGSSFVVDLATASTLSEIQEAINSDTNETGVAAGLITGDNGNQTLVLTSSETGFDNRVEVSFGGSLGAASFNFSLLNRDSNDQLLAAESELDASLTVDGVAVTRGRNEISDVVSGLTLNLTGAGQANVYISRDTAPGRKALEGFIQVYNELKEQLGKMGSGGGKGSFVRGLESQLRGVLNKDSSVGGGVSYISQLGVTSNRATGKLELDSDMFLDAMQDDREGVIEFFGGDGGFISSLDSMLEGFLGPGGTIDGIVKGANNRIDGIERKRDSMERRLESVEQRYLKQFGGLDTLMASMTTTSNYLATQLDMLSRMVGRDNN